MEGSRKSKTNCILQLGVLLNLALTILSVGSGTVLEQKDDFKYLGSWVDKSIKDVNIRKALAWKALNDMTNIWKSTMNPVLKKRFFVATVESILLYGCESWSMTESMVKSLSGAYTRMLRKALNVHWSSRTTNDEVYGELPRLDVKIAERRLRLAGHCYRHPELSTQKLILWEPTHGTRSRGRPQSNYVDTLKRDTGAISSHELATLMEDRVVWSAIVKSRSHPPN
ncbi:hypothetical protein AC249_AIPGENE24955 [Exaiptasia diaphana]|nr:hypothetical protein AC249_AIPGENE24955 [Exaiptasia diaphana]